MTYPGWNSVKTWKRKNIMSLGVDEKEDDDHSAGPSEALLDAACSRVTAHHSIPQCLLFRSDITQLAVLVCMHCYNKIPRTGYFINNANLSLMALETGKSMIKVKTNSVPKAALHFQDGALIAVDSHGRRETKG